jgi:hypothetical protein
MAIFGIELNAHVLIVIFILATIMSCHLFVSCSRISPMKIYNQIKSTIFKEGFGVEGIDDVKQELKHVFSTIDHGESATSKWMTASKQHRMDDENEGDLRLGTIFTQNQPNNFFVGSKFSDKCCPSAYSSSGGCACLSTEQINYLKARGGNRRA